MVVDVLSKLIWRSIECCDLKGLRIKRKYPVLSIDAYILEKQLKEIIRLCYVVLTSIARSLDN